MPTEPPAKRHPYDQWSPDARALDLVGDKWTLLIVRDLMSGPRRFVEIQRILPGISTEQLRTRLNRMVADGLLVRRRYREVPPRVDYELTERAEDLAPVLGELGRWGYRWAWGEPRPGEEIDVGAILRLAPGMLHPSTDVHGRVAATVTQRSKGWPEATYVIECADGCAVIGERADDDAEADADARISGAERAWVEALGPERSRAGLAIEGDHGLAGRLLDGIAAATKADGAATAAA